MDATGDLDVVAQAGGTFVTDAKKDSAGGNVQHCLNTAFTWTGVDTRTWLAFKRDNPAAHHALTNRGRELLGFVDTPHVGWRDDVVVFMGPRLSGYSGLDVEHLSLVELESRRRMVAHLDFFRKEAPGFENAWIMLAAPQIGVRMTSGNSARSFAARARSCTSRRQAQASAVKHRPADVVAQPLVVKHEQADRLGQPTALPLALVSPRGLAQAFRCRRLCGLDRVGGGAELVRGDVGDGPGLARGVRGLPWRPAQVSGCPHRMSACRASLHHRDLAPRPGPGLGDCLARARVPRPGRLEEPKDVLRAQGSPQSQKTVIRVGEGPATADRHEARVPDLREDHDVHSPSGVSGQPHQYPR